MGLTEHVIFAEEGLRDDDERPPLGIVSDPKVGNSEL